MTLLSGVLRKRKPLDAQLDNLKSLPARDAGFARALASQTLRHLGSLETLLRHFVPKPLAPHKAGPATEILLLGACELLILKVPAHAAVDAANNLAAADGKAVHFKSLINAVLRRIAREGEAARAWMRCGSTRPIGCGRAGARNMAKMSRARLRKRITRKRRWIST